VTSRVSQENWNSSTEHSNNLCALSPLERADVHREDLTSVAFLPFVGPTFNHISRVLIEYKCGRRTGDYKKIIKSGEYIESIIVVSVIARFSAAP
jgi:hypothetical protein